MTRLSASTLIACIADVSMTSPWSTVPQPAKLWPPLRTATGRPWRSANSTQRPTSSGPEQRATNRGVRSVSALR
jgi:hypothetical protein